MTWLITLTESKMIPDHKKTKKFGYPKIGFNYPKITIKLCILKTQMGWQTVGPNLDILAPKNCSLTPTPRESENDVQNNEIVKKSYVR